MCALMVLAWRGLAVGKWVNNFGGLAIMLRFFGMVAIAAPHWLHWHSVLPPVTAPLAFTLPAISLVSLKKRSSY
jgi:hypothetical protein